MPEGQPHVSTCTSFNAGSREGHKHTSANRYPLTDIDSNSNPNTDGHALA